VTIPPAVGCAALGDAGSETPENARRPINVIVGSVEWTSCASTIQEI
jgi:hypothetical protein